MSKKILGLLAAGATLLAIGTAPARAVVLDFTVWTGTPNGISSSQTANQAGAPTSTNLTTFEYNTGSSFALNFADNSPQNTTSAGGLFSTFFGAGAANISAFSSNVYTGATVADQIANFLASSMSIAGNGYTTYMKITGLVDFGGGQLVTVTHDDGASFYLTDPLTTEFTSAAETIAISNSFTVSGTHTIELDYVAGNGTPSILQVAAVPEPATWAMIILGFAGVGFMAYRRKNSASAFRFS